MLLSYQDARSGTKANLLPFKPTPNAREGWLITNIHVPAEQRRKRHAKKMLTRLCREANLDGTSLYSYIDPSEDVDGLTQEVVTRTLKKFGFHKFEAPNDVKLSFVVWVRIYEG